VGARRRQLSVVLDAESDRRAGALLERRRHQTIKDSVEGASTACL
jgi:hypothetical protein